MKMSSTLSFKKMVRRSLFEAVFQWRRLSIFIHFVLMAGLDQMFVDNGKLGGPKKRVQIDEMKFGKMKYNRGCPVDDNWIFGAIEKETKRLRLEIIPDNKRDQNSMQALIEKPIEGGTIVNFRCRIVLPESRTMGEVVITV